jgi:hypothetical protein
MDRIVVNGHENAVDALWFRLLREVYAAHRDAHRRAGFLRRFLLRHRMRREIMEHLDRLAPPDALYARGPGPIETPHES